MADNAPAAVYEFDIEETEYLRHGDTPYLARLFKPRGDGPFPAVIDMHGGGWCAGKRTNNDPINAAMARAGVVVAALDFRVPPDAPYPSSVADLNYGIRWLKREAKRLHSRPDLVGAMGTSSGGHLVVLSAMRPTDARYGALPLAGPVYDARVKFVITLWPVISPLGRYQFLKERRAKLPPARIADMMESHDRYWISEAAMAEGDPVLALQRGERAELPPILYLQNPQDPLHPRDNLEQFVAGYRAAGGQVEVVLFEGAEYDLLRSRPDAPSACQAWRSMADFAHRMAGA
jgi:acetyl esterase